MTAIKASGLIEKYRQQIWFFGRRYYFVWINFKENESTNPVQLDRAYRFLTIKELVFLPKRNLNVDSIWVEAS